MTSADMKFTPVLLKMSCPDILWTVGPGLLTTWRSIQIGLKSVNVLMITYHSNSYDHWNMMFSIMGFLGVLVGKTAYSFLLQGLHVFQSLLPTNYSERGNPLNPFISLPRIEGQRTLEGRLSIIGAGNEGLCHIWTICEMSMWHWPKTIRKLIIESITLQWFHRSCSQVQRERLRESFFLWTWEQLLWSSYNNWLSGQ